MLRRRPRKDPPPTPLTHLILGVVAILTGLLILAFSDTAATGIFVIALGVLNLILAEWRRRNPWVS
jgi:uncharacterized membrane protein HdeD (DUF308 family)